MKVRYCSDLHLEFNEVPLKRFNPKRDEILLVAGDTVPTTFLAEHRTDADSRTIKNRFNKFLYHVAGYHMVYFIAGNHEHYQGNISDCHFIFTDYLNKLGFFNRIRFLEDECVPLNDDTYLLACTLWTNFNKNNPYAHLIAEDTMNDYKLISHGEKKFKTEDAYNIHTRSLQHLSEMYHYHTNDFEKKAPNKKTKIIVMTHMPPSFKSLKDKYVSTIDHAFSSDLSEFILDRPQITHWVTGHTHHPCDYKIGDCNILSNPLGYGVLGVRDACFNGFSTDSYFEV